ncbi:hypothetical protein [Nocardia sp. NPDC006630]|uniref:hypothetical protein n=1 Tax=Nocardia sp. NPDC006630 TaxID=3157181 RepID=UPI0033BEFC08
MSTDETHNDLGGQNDPPQFTIERSTSPVYANGQQQVLLNVDAQKDSESAEPPAIPAELLSDDNNIIIISD